VDPDIEKQYGLLELLLINYGELIKAQSVISICLEITVKASKKLQVHKSLFLKDKRFLLNYVPFDMEKFRKIYTYLDTIDEKVRNDYRHDLLKDVNTIEVSLLQR